MTLFKLLYQIGLIKPSLRQVKRWTKQRNIENLCFALDHGLYNVRIEAAKALGELKARSALPTLRKRLKDSVKPVAIESAKSLKTIGISVEVENEIVTMNKFWEQKELKAKTRKKRSKNLYIPKWEKRDWVEILREQLKKPMRR
ncbi:MAG: HEAT repeat domain-containing protein [Prolixibacteraceae bacterium]